MRMELGSRNRRHIWRAMFEVGCHHRSLASCLSCLIKSKPPLCLTSQSVLIIEPRACEGWAQCRVVTGAVGGASPTHCDLCSCLQILGRQRARYTSHLTHAGESQHWTLWMAIATFCSQLSGSTVINPSRDFINLDLVPNVVSSFPLPLHCLYNK